MSGIPPVDRRARPAEFHAVISPSDPPRQLRSRTIALKNRADPVTIAPPAIGGPRRRGHRNAATISQTMSRMIAISSSSRAARVGGVADEVVHVGERASACAAPSPARPAGGSAGPRLVEAREVEVAHDFHRVFEPFDHLGELEQQRGGAALQLAVAAGEDVRDRAARPPRSRRRCGAARGRAARRSSAARAGGRSRTRAGPGCPPPPTARPRGRCSSATTARSSSR